MAPALNHPGVYIQEMPAGLRSIAGVPTSVAAFLGTAMRGPLNQPVRIQGFSDYEREFGGLVEDCELGYAVLQFFLNGGAEAWVVRVGLPAQNGPQDTHAAFIGQRPQRLGLYALDHAHPFNLLCLPGVTHGGVLADAVSYCKERRAFMIVDAPQVAAEAASMAAAVMGTALPKSDHAAVYFPWTRTADPLRIGQPRLTPPCGTIAGLYARTDGNRGVWKAPAGIDAGLTGVLSLAATVSDDESRNLNALGVNCLRTFPGRGAVCWGARTLQGTDHFASEYKYVPVRRLALHLEQSLSRGTQWAAFEPNDEPLWAQIRLNVGAYMNALFRQGAFQGNAPRDAYLVKCDSETTSQQDVDHGVVNILVGFAPLKPAEFVVIRVQQRAGQMEGRQP
ncbi:phage tail sheath family protein [Achromobacter sp.]|uniref:phage tail sheath family protein n=1 Tax=Achromobacter sp. TaxID=134375 RepID=UPI002F93D5D6